MQEKIERFDQYPDFVRFLFEDVSPDGADPGALPRGARPPRRRSPTGALPAIEEALRALADELGQKPRQAFAPIRLAVTGSKVSPGLFESIELLGRERTLQRLAAAASLRLGPVAEDRRRRGDDPGDPHGPELEHRADGEGERAAEREQDRGERPGELGGVGLLHGDRLGRRLRRCQPQPGEPDAEERAAPLVQQRRDAVEALLVERLGDLGGRVARAAERPGELVVERLGCRAGGSRPYASSDAVWSEYWRRCSRAPASSAVSESGSAASRSSSERLRESPPHSSAIALEYCSAVLVPLTLDNASHVGPGRRHPVRVAA